MSKTITQSKRQHEIKEIVEENEYSDSTSESDLSVNSQQIDQKIQMLTDDEKEKLR